MKSPSSALARPLSPVPARGVDARVALVPVVVGDRGELMDLARPTHAGLVLEAFGAGNVPPGAVPAIRRWLDEGKTVVLASRCAGGAVAPAYAFEGGGAGLVAMGVVPAGSRTPSQAKHFYAVMGGCMAAGLIILFTPPFDKSKLDPGYIKGYVPGVRENGGQYTHAALWTVIAFALLGDGDRAVNMDLSRRRAESVKTYFVSKGIDANRLVAIGRGEADPIVSAVQEL